MRYRFVAALPARSSVVTEGEVTREAFGRATIESRREAHLGFDLVGRSPMSSWTKETG